LVVYDLLYFTLATLLYGGAVYGGLRIRAALDGWPPLLAWPIALLGGLIALIAEVGLLSALCPRLKPGRYAMMKGPVFWGWMFRSLLRRVLLLPSLKWVIFSSNVLRFLALRAMGARVAFTVSISADVDLLDPSLLTIGPGAVIGARCGLSGHYVENGQLVIDGIRVGARALLAADVGVGPGCSIGPRAFIKPRSTLTLFVNVGEGAEIGPAALLDPRATVGKGAFVGSGGYVGARGVVADGGRVEAMTSASSATSKAAPAV